MNAIDFTFRSPLVFGVAALARLRQYRRRSMFGDAPAAEDHRGVGFRGGARSRRHRPRLQRAAGSQRAAITRSWSASSARSRASTTRSWPRRHPARGRARGAARQRGGLRSRRAAVVTAVARREGSREEPAASARPRRVADMTVSFLRRRKQLPPSRVQGAASSPASRRRRNAAIAGARPKTRRASPDAKRRRAGSAARWREGRGLCQRAGLAAATPKQAG